MTVAELLVRISSRELSEWMAYYQVEPFGEERADLRTASTNTLVANLVGRKKGQRAYKMNDFMLKFEAPKNEAEVNPDELVAYVAVLNEMFGGKDERSPRHGRDGKME